MDLRFAPLIHDVSHISVIPKGWQYWYWSYPRVFGHSQELAVLILGPPFTSFSNIYWAPTVCPTCKTLTNGSGSSKSSRDTDTVRSGCRGAGLEKCYGGELIQPGRGGSGKTGGGGPSTD